MGDGVKFKAASDQSLLVYFGNKITLETHGRVIRLLHLLQSEPIPSVRNLHPAYASVLLDFDALKITHRELEGILRGYFTRAQALPLPKPRMLELPVCYGGEFGPDLDEVARLHRMTPAQAVKLHSSVSYVVYFLGFVPGFAYLGTLPRALATPRLSSPRRSTAAGSVGIADRQTGIYPFATPGGWRLIGRTPVAMFDSIREGMSLLKVGDRVRFVPISADQFRALESA